MSQHHITPSVLRYTRRDHRLNINQTVYATAEALLDQHPSGVTAWEVADAIDIVSGGEVQFSQDQVRLRLRKRYERVGDTARYCRPAPGAP